MLVGRRMRTFSWLALAFAAACGASSGVTNPPPKAVDPAIAIRLLDHLDTTTAMGRASWAAFALIYSGDPTKTGVARVASPSANVDWCINFQADSIGQRYVVILALTDTATGLPSATATQAQAQAWYNGNHTLPSGWVALASDSVDWGVSQQFTNGHGRTTADPVRWDVTWTSPATITRAEAPNDTTCH